MPEESQTVWLTRDENAAGELSEMVDVWLAPPSWRRLEDGGSAWLGPGVTGLEERYAQWPIDVARKNSNSGVVPDTGRECIRLY